MLFILWTPEAGFLVGMVEKVAVDRDRVARNVRCQLKISAVKEAVTAESQGIC